MMNPFHTCTGNVAICEAANTLYSQAMDTAMELDNRSKTESEVVESIHQALTDLAARAPQAIDRDFALDAYRALGRTIGHWMVVSDGGLTENGWLLREEIEDLEATMEMTFASPELLGTAGDGIETYLTAVSWHDLAAVGEGEHHAELFLATALAGSLVGAAAG